MAQQQADALGLLAESALHHGIESGAPGERYQVVVHVDAPVLADPDAPGQSVLDDGVHVSAETSRRLACDATRVVMRHDPDGQVTEVGARTRTIPPALRRALHYRDGTCRFPGCARRFGQGHHIRHWANGGPPRCRTLRCSVAGTTGRFTRPDIGWSDSLTGSCASGGRTVDYCPTCRRPLRCRPIPSTRSARGMTRRGCASTRARRCRAGSESAWTSATRSTSFIRSPDSERGRVPLSRRAGARARRRVAPRAAERLNPAA